MSHSDIDKRGEWEANAYGHIWNGSYPNGDYPAPTKMFLLTVNGTGFGSGPSNIDIFDRLNGIHGENAFPGSPERGAWDAVSSYGTGMPKYFHDASSGRSYMAGRSIDDINATARNMVNLFKRFNPTAKFRFSQRVRVPSGMIFPGGLTPGVFPTDSTYKMTWHGQDNGTSNLLGRDQPYRNLCIPTMIGNGGINVGGNNNSPAYFDGYEKLMYGNFTFLDSNFYTYYQDGAGVADTYTIPCEFTSINPYNAVRNLRDCDPFAGPISEGVWTNRSYNAFTLPGWFGNDDDDNYANHMCLIADVYQASGDNSRAMIAVSSADTYPAPSYTCQSPHETWTDTQITFRITEYEYDRCNQTPHVHILLANNTLLQNVAYTIEEI